MAKTQNEPYFRKSRGTWAVWHNGRQITLGKEKAAAFGIWDLLKSGLDIETARAKWTMLKAGNEPQQDDPGLTLESLFGVFLDWCKVNRSEGTYNWYRRYLLSFATFKGYGRLHVTELKARHVKKWVTTKYGDNSDTTVPGKIGAVVSALNWCAKPEQGYIPVNPIRGMERPKADHREVYIMDQEWEQVEKKLQECAPEVQDIILFIWNTGCRPQEARWAECHHFNKHIPAIVFEVKRSKGKKRRRVPHRGFVLDAFSDRSALVAGGSVVSHPAVRPPPGVCSGRVLRPQRVGGGRQRCESSGRAVPQGGFVLDAFSDRSALVAGGGVVSHPAVPVPLNPDALAIVQRLVLKHGEGPIFRSKHGKGYTASGLRSAFRRVSGFSPYDIHHTFATNSITRGVDLISLSEIMGHTDLTMLKKNYSHLLMAGDHIQRAVRQATHVV